MKRNRRSLAQQASRNIHIQPLSPGDVRTAAPFGHNLAQTLLRMADQAEEVL